MEEIIKMLKKYEPDFREMDAGEIKTIVEVLNAFISDYRARNWNDRAMGYGDGKWETDSQPKAEGSSLFKNVCAVRASLDGMYKEVQDATYEPA